MITTKTVAKKNGRRAKAKAGGRLAEKAVEDVPKGGVILKIPALNFRVMKVKIRGVTPYVQNRMSAKAQEIIERIQEAGTTAKGKKERPKKDFVDLYNCSMYESEDGWRGIPSAAFRKAMVRACSATSITMVTGKLSIFILHDGIDKDSGTSLTKITKGKPRMIKSPVRIASGSMDIHSRALWEEGWEATVTIDYDANLLEPEDIVNLLAHAGKQVGVGEGRPYTRDSEGVGWGQFEIVND